MGYPPNLTWGPPWTWDGVTPGPGMGYPLDLGWGTPLDLGPSTPPDLGPGTPQTWDWVPPPPDQVWIRQSSTASTCYAAGGVPLAFTQGDFLVCFCKYIRFQLCDTSLIFTLFLQLNSQGKCDIIAIDCDIMLDKQVN